jgi:CDP-paratose 2-epimerase
MSVVIITGAAGLIGSEAATHFAGQGLEVVGIDNDMRRHFFGDDASIRPSQARLEATLPRYRHHNVDIRDQAAIGAIFERYGREIVLVIHTAAQPSHDWAARDPVTDFTINANGTLVLLESARSICPEATFIFCSTNKVYGDRPNDLPLEEQALRWEIAETHPYYVGIDESMSIDDCKHSLFGASKLAADVLVQEYGRYFGMRTAVFRGGCLTGPDHSGTQLHGFLSYLMKCTMTGEPYSVFGYKGKQVRDNIHSHDLVRAFSHVHEAPRVGQVYNIGGGRFSNCSMLEAIEMCEAICGKTLNWRYVETSRIGDHIWWISDQGKFKEHYPGWELTYSIQDILEQIFTSNTMRWA